MDVLCQSILRLYNSIQNNRLSNFVLEDELEDFLKSKGIKRKDYPRVYFVWSSKNQSSNSDLNKQIEKSTSPFFYIFVVVANHWVFLVYMKEQNQVAFYNSLPTYRSEQFKPETLLKTLNLPIETASVILCENIRQSGDWECGYYALCVFKKVFEFCQEHPDADGATIQQHICIDEDELKRDLQEQCAKYIGKRVSEQQTTSSVTEKKQ